MTGVGVASDGKWETLGGASRTGFPYLLKWVGTIGSLFFPFPFFLPVLPREVALGSPGRGKKEDRSQHTKKDIENRLKES